MGERDNFVWRVVITDYPNGDGGPGGRVPDEFLSYRELQDRRHNEDDSDYPTWPRRSRYFSKQAAEQVLERVTRWGATAQPTSSGRSRLSGTGHPTVAP